MTAAEDRARPSAQVAGVDSALEKHVAVVWEGDLAFVAQTESGHRVVMDTAPAAGEARRGPTPMELVLAALGGCTGIDVISILRKMRQQVTRYEIRAGGTRAEEHPRVYRTIVVEHTVYGAGLQPAAVERAIRLSTEKYCSVGAMLARTAALVVRWRAIDTTSNVETAGEFTHSV